ncbi:MAG: hypothetical protein M0R76_11610 [Proteobacteria bacterium]|nr:hypothetical protein [Pseudomonadota bacterium]
MKNNLRYLIAYSFLSLLLLIFSGTKTNAGVNKIILVKIETESQKQLLESLSNHSERPKFLCPLY